VHHCRREQYTIRNSNSCWFRGSAREIRIYGWAIIAISKHVIANNALAGGGIGVGVEETADGGAAVGAGGVTFALHLPQSAKSAN